MDYRTRLAGLFISTQVIVVSISFLYRHILVWNFRLIDFVDLVVLGPFYLIMFVLIGKSLVIPETPRIRSLTFLYLFFFFEGHAMHLTANAIDTFAFEVNDYQIPNDLRNLIHFLDEILGHALFFLGLFGLFQIVLISEPSLEGPLELGEMLFNGLIGVIYGISLTIAVIEAQYFIYWYIAYCILSIISSLTILNYPNAPYRTILLSTFISSIITSLVYWLTFGDFVQPSELMA